MQRRPPAAADDAASGGVLPALDSGINIGAAQEVIDDLWTRSAVPALCDFIRVPSQSPIFDPEWETNGLLDQSIEVLVAWVRAQKIDGATVEVLRPTSGITPIIWVEIEARGAESDEAGTILMYGHADTQPPMADDWAEGLGPYEPVERDGKLYGRGANDDGYAVFAAVSAVQAMKAQGLSHGRVVIFIEASEESGSVHLPQHLESFSSRIGAETPFWAPFYTKSRICQDRLGTNIGNPNT
jgi:acetylornithine deacetylase/succinyl-diaminopimelate desuccinylase-like protein